LGINELRFSLRISAHVDPSIRPEEKRRFEKKGFEGKESAGGVRRQRLPPTHAKFKKKPAFEKPQRHRDTEKKTGEILFS